jgi:membrane-bound inhibitor of C-type lysozyme
MRRIIAASIAVVGLTGAPSSAASRQAAPAKDGELRVYYCQNLALMTVRVLPKRVEVTTASRTTTLTEDASASPTRYSNGAFTLSGLDDLVRYEEPGAIYWCRVEPSEVPWQDARLRGIDFRAAGDPSWSLEIDNGVGTEFTAGQGAARVATKFPAVALTGKDNRMTMTAASGAHALTMTAERRICHYAGSAMTLSVTVTFDGRTYNGCGRMLVSESPEAERKER